MLELAQAAHADHGLARYSHVSTAYVAGGRSGVVPEDALTGEYGFSCAYEFSKYEGERLVQAAGKGLPVSVFRPGMIVGDSATGEIRTFNTLYFPLRLYLTGQLPVMPAGRAQRVNLVPVDYVADAIARLTFMPEAAGLNFHLVAPYAALPQADELVEFVREWARDTSGSGCGNPSSSPLPLPRGRYEPGPRRPRSDEGMLAALLTLLPYFNEHWSSGATMSTGSWAPTRTTGASSCHTCCRTRLTRASCTARSGPYTSRCCTGWGQEPADQLSRHFRRAHDHPDGPRSAAGHAPRDRGAQVPRRQGRETGWRWPGTNSTRYLALDVAIGMVGAVSVPVYYTSPPADIDHILAASGARAFFVGFPRCWRGSGRYARMSPSSRSAANRRQASRHGPSCPGRRSSRCRPRARSIRTRRRR